MAFNDFLNSYCNFKVVCKNKVNEENQFIPSLPYKKDKLMSGK